MEGKPVVGTVLRHTSRLPGRKPMQFQPTIVAAQPGSVLAWKGRVLVPGLFDVYHRFEMSPCFRGGTRLEQCERFSGVLVPFSRRTLRQTRQAFVIANEAIKARSESLVEPRANLRLL